MRIDNLIYKEWRSLTPDLRYLRLKRWKVIKKVILNYNLKTVLEFGSGISTILFANLGMQVISFETSPKFMHFVSNLCQEVPIIHWNNKKLWLSGRFDLALVDGILPRDRQLEISIKHAKFIAVDDYIGELRDELSTTLTNLERIDEGSTPLAIFKGII